jgi:hypothetical protein
MTVKPFSGVQARVYRKGVEPSGSLQTEIIISFSSSGFIPAQEGPSFISRTVTQPPCGPALLVTQDPLLTSRSHRLGPPIRHTKPSCVEHRLDAHWRRPGHAMSLQFSGEQRCARPTTAALPRVRVHAIFFRPGGSRSPILVIAIPNSLRILKEDPCALPPLSFPP